VRDIILSNTYVSAQVDSFFSSQFRRVRQLKCFVKETIYIFKEINNFPTKLQIIKYNKEGPLVLQSLDMTKYHYSLHSSFTNNFPNSFVINFLER